MGFNCSFKLAAGFEIGFGSYLTIKLLYFIIIQKFLVHLHSIYINLLWHEIW